MPAVIVKGAVGQPGPAAYPNGIDTGIFNELNYVIPEYKPQIVAKYGNDSYMLVMELLGKSIVETASTTTGTFSHFEMGRPFGSALVATAVLTVASGVNQTVVLKSPESYNNVAGTQSPFMVDQTVKIRSNGRKARVVSVNRTTAGAFSVVLQPLGNYALITGTSGTTLNALEGLETFGNQAAGESSDSQGTMSIKKFRYDNTATVIRSSTKSSDLAGMNKTQIDFGGGNYYEPALAVKTMNINMLMNIEDAVMEGVPYANTPGVIGTVGVLPEVIARGSEVNYVFSTFGVTDFQNVTNVLDANGGPRDYHMLQDLKQRQDINRLLFGLYNNGAISYGSVGGSEEASVSYGFKGFSTDTFDFHFHRYKGFTAPAQFGYTPTQGDYRANFGLAVPQGMVQDTQNNTKPYMQFVYQQNPDIPAGQKIYSWDLGYTKNTKTTKAENRYEQIAYVGSRIVAAEQFVILRGLVS